MYIDFGDKAVQETMDAKKNGREHERRHAEPHEIIITWAGSVWSVPGKFQ